MDLNDLKELNLKIKSIKEAVNIDNLKKESAKLTALFEDPNIYNDLQKSKEINSKLKKLNEKIEQVQKLIDSSLALTELYEISEEDSQMLKELENEYQILLPKVEKLYLSTLLKGEYDANNAIITIHPGAGGTEAQDWAKMLYRMYKMYCEKEGYQIEEIEYSDGDEAGLKNVIFFVKGSNAYGFLKAERGVHRLVRISPFDSNSRRHTSFASVEAMPEIENDTIIKVKPEELKIDTYRSGGAGGQHVNKTESAIRITHLPTGIVVQCQNERSQVQNKEIAMKLLMGKLAELKERELYEKAQGIKGELKKIEWGSQIRSYVFHPYNLVKDHRTNYETSDIYKVMDGNIEDFIICYLKKSVI